MGIGVFLAGLASAVAEAGGVGVISAAGIGGEESDFKSNYVPANSRALRREIREARSRTSGVLGVNIMVALTNYAELVRASVEEGIDIIFSGAGLPLDLPRHLAGKTSPKLVPIVSSGRAAGVICKKWRSGSAACPTPSWSRDPWPAGTWASSRNRSRTRISAWNASCPRSSPPWRVLPDIPVIAAGGVYTGADIRKYLDLGAKACRWAPASWPPTSATRPRPSTGLRGREKRGHAHHQSPVGLPGRVIRNTFIDKVEGGERCPVSCPFHCLRGCDYLSSPFCITLALLNAKRGHMNNGLIFAGENAWRVTGIVSVAELLAELISGYAATFQS
jgi:nitronate monooxygenase